MSVQALLNKVLRLGPPETDEARPPPVELVGFFVRLVRGMRQWKQSTLAAFAGVSLSTVERVERGEQISSECLERIGQKADERAS